MPGKKNPRKNSQMAKKVPYYVLAKLNDRNCKEHTLMEYAIAKGEPIKAIARFFRVTPAAVRYHRNKLFQKLKDKQPTRKKLSKKQKSVMLRRNRVKMLATQRAGPFDRKVHRSAAQIAGALRTRFRLFVSRETVRADLRALDFASKVGGKEPILTPEKLQRRLEFIKTSTVPPELILFSDECYVGATVDGRREWCLPGEKPERRQVDRFEGSWSLG
jgi:hypothetical protein